MTNAEAAADFKHFMNWFRETYPDYYSKYSINMKAAKDDRGFSIMNDNIDKTVYNILFEIQNEYYLTHL